MGRRKLKLDVETLNVDSFGIDAASRRTGTVHGHASRLLCTQYASCEGSCATCPNDSCYTCDDGYTCASWEPNFVNG